MVKVRVRLASAAAFSVLVACIVASSLVAVPAAPAADAAPLLEARTLFLTERFSATGPARGPITGTLPENLVALRGEREGFQVAVNNTTGSTLSLSGRIVPDVALGAQQSAGTIDFEILRVGFVKLPQGSKNMGAPGMYPDPLPPLVNDVELGHLSVPGGQWGGVAVLAKVRTDAAAGPYAGTLELFTGTPGANETVYARQPFTLDVRNTTLLQPGSKKSFKTVMNVEAEAYWLQNDHMRNGVNRPFFLPADADRMAQLSGLFKFVDSRNVTPLEFTFGNPSTAGAYNCSYDSPGSVPAKSFLSQLQERYFGRARDIVLSGRLGRVVAISLERASGQGARTSWRTPSRR